MTTTITPEERATYKKWAEGFPTTTSGNIRTGTEVAIGKLLNALEATEARADEAEAWATRLVWAVTDGRMSKLYDIEIIEEEVNTLWGERISQEVFEAEQRAEKAEAERNWLAKQVAHLHARHIGSNFYKNNNLWWLEEAARVVAFEQAAKEKEGGDNDNTRV